MALDHADARAHHAGEALTTNLTRTTARSAILDNSRRLAAKLDQARRELDEPDYAELVLFTEERLLEASLRFR